MVPLTMPEHAGDPVTGQRLAQRAQQRDRAGDAGLVVEVDAGRAAASCSVGAVLGEQRLVGGDDRCPRRSAVQQQRPGRLDAADHLDDDVDVVAGDQRGGVGGEQRRVDRQVAVRGRAGARRCRPARAAHRPGRRGRRPGRAAAARPREPTTPQPSRATLIGCAACARPAVTARPSAQQVVLGLAAHDQPRRSPPRDRDDRRPRHVVVVAGHRAAVGAGRRRPRSGRPGRRRRAATRRGRRCRRSRSACRRRGPAPARRRERPGGQQAGVVGVVERGADVVAHAAVDGDVGRGSPPSSVDLLDGADLVERDGRRPDDRPARLDRRAAARQARAAALSRDDRASDAADCRRASAGRPRPA